MPLPFAKLFELPGGYQLLVQAETDKGDDEYPYVLSYTTEDAAGVTIRFAGSYKTQLAREKQFARITPEEAKERALNMLRVIDNTFQFPA